MDLIVAGTEAAVLMVESEAKQLSEEIMLGGVVFGHEQGNVAINAIHELVRDAGKPVWDWQAPAKDEAFIAKVSGLAEQKLRDAYQIRSKQARTQALREVTASAHGRAARQSGAAFDTVKVDNLLFDIEAKIVRSQILAGEPRIDGRDTRTVRPIEIRTGVLPRTHGSALFTRGETQALVVATLGTERDAQRIDALAGEYNERFMLHYNMPPFATGETGRVGSPKRREIGHGRLAKRALVAVLPTAEEFPYTMRVVSEITESNGSSSMASVCGGCLSLMDAGVPMKAHVAGIAMGLIKEGNRFAVLTDILGDEDHLGDMDFKVAGTTNGITALQMDIKIQGITKEIMQVALAQAKEARMHILGKMQEAMGGAKTEVSQFAPRLYTMKINPEKIRDVIGKGGAAIRALTEETGCTIDIGEDGTITIASTDADKAEHAKKRIERDHRRSRDRQGLRRPDHQDPGLRRAGQPAARQGRPAAHQPDRPRARREGHRLPEEGQIVRVKVLETDEKGRVKLSMKALLDRDSRRASSTRTRSEVARCRRGASRESHRDRRAGRARGAASGRAADAGARAGRGADPRRRLRRQPARRAAAQGHLPGAAGRVRPARASRWPARSSSGDAEAMARPASSVGDRVCALVAGGGYAELLRRAGRPVPAGAGQGLSDIEAACLPETFFTVWSNVFDRGRLQPGETLLIQGGTSGIGVTAIQMAKALRRDGDRHRRHRRQGRGLPGARRRPCHQLQDPATSPKR